jgi:hypothetical protein
VYKLTSVYVYFHTFLIIVEKTVEKLSTFGIDYVYEVCRSHAVLLLNFIQEGSTG